MSATGNGGGGGDTGAVVVPIKVEADGSSLDAMRAKLKGAEDQLAEFQRLAKFSTSLDVDVADAQRNVKALTAEVRGLERANKDAAKEAEKAAKEQAKLGVAAFKFQQKAAADKDKDNAARIKDIFGTSVFELGARSLAGAFGKGKEETKAIEGALMAGGAAISGGATIALAAAGALASAAIGITAATVKLGIESTAQKQRNIDILDKLTRGQGEEAEAFSKSLAAQTGVAEDAAMERVKGLIQAKFNKQDTGAIFKASADIGAVKGEGKAELFLKTLERIQFEGAATERSVKALEGAGVDKGDLLAGLAKAGETTEQVEARLKAGKVAADEFARAAAAVVQKDIGGVAGKGLDAMVNRLKIGFGDLFDGMDDGVSSLEKLGGIVEEALSGAEGEKLKKSITEAGNAVLNLAKNVTAADVKTLFDAASSAASHMAESIKTAADAAAKLWNITKQLSGSGSHTESDKGGFFGSGTDEQIVHEIEQGNLRAELREKEKAFREKQKAEAAAGGDASGKALADGTAAGIEANAGKPAAAAADMMKKTIAAADAAAKIHSPSRVMWDRGDYLDQGAAKGIDDNADKPAAAATRMMGRVVRAGERGPEGGIAAASGGIGASSFAAAGGGAVYHFSPNVSVVGGGSDAEMKGQVDRALLAAYPGFLAMLRQSQRDSQENRLPMVSA